MTQRVHKILLDGARNHFAHVAVNGKPLDLNAAAAGVNPKWPPYTEVCLEGWELYPHEAPDGTHQQWVLRANVRCCCASPCFYASDHAGQDAYSKIAQTAPSPSVKVQTPHGPAQGYAEGVLGGSDLAALSAQATAVVGDPAARAKLAQTLSGDAATFALSASEIEGVLGVEGADVNGLLSAPGATALVLSGASTVANDWYCVAAILKLWQRTIHAAHQRLALDWPQQGVARPIRLGGAR